jgi:hypothetical protein
VQERDDCHVAEHFPVFDEAAQSVRHKIPGPDRGAASGCGIHAAVPESKNQIRFGGIVAAEG